MEGEGEGEEGFWLLYVLNRHERFCCIGFGVGVGGCVRALFAGTGCQENDFVMYYVF